MKECVTQVTYSRWLISPVLLKGILASLTLSSTTSRLLTTSTEGTKMRDQWKEIQHSHYCSKEIKKFGHEVTLRSAGRGKVRRKQASREWRRPSLWRLRAILSIDPRAGLLAVYPSNLELAGWRNLTVRIHLFWKGCQKLHTAYTKIQPLRQSWPLEAKGKHALGI